MDQKSRSMTMEEILNSSQETLVPVQIAAVLGYNPHSIRVQAKFEYLFAAEGDSVGVMHTNQSA